MQVQAIHQALLGLEGTDDKGLVGDFKELKGDVKKQNGRVLNNTKKIWYILGVLGIVGGAAGTALSQVF